MNAVHSQHACVPCVSVPVQAVVALLKKAGDRAEPVTLMRLQLGLVHALHGPTDASLDHLRSRLGKLSSMIQVRSSCFLAEHAPPFHMFPLLCLPLNKKYSHLVDLR